MTDREEINAIAMRYTCGGTKMCDLHELLDALVDMCEIKNQKFKSDLKLIKGDLKVSEYERRMWSSINRPIEDAMIDRLKTEVASNIKNYIKVDLSHEDNDGSLTYSAELIIFNKNGEINSTTNY